MLSLLLSLAVAAEPAERPHLIASLHVSPMTSFPDLLGASVTVHAIPYVDLSGGVSGYTDRFGWWARGGPRLLIVDARDESNRGLTWRGAALLGYRAFRDAKGNAGGFSAAVASDFAYFFAAHFGVSVQVAMGAMYDAPTKRWLPELRLGLGLAF